LLGSIAGRLSEIKRFAIYSDPRVGMCALPAASAYSHALAQDAHESLLPVEPRSSDRDTPELIIPTPYAGAELNMCRRTSPRCRSHFGQRSAMLYFVWYDDSPKKPVAEKIQEAIAAYVTRFAIQPSLLLVNAVDHMEFTNVLVRAERTVQPNTFWLGFEEIAEAPTA